MSNRDEQGVYECDCAIIGGGVSGVYAGWRLLTGEGSSCQGKKVAIFEMSNRLGGRLLSWLPFGSEGGLRAELGGMRFYRATEDQNHQLKGHQLVHKLVEQLELKTEKFYTYDEPAEQDHTILYLRGARMSYRKPDLSVLEQRYLLQGEERTIPDKLLAYVIDTVVRESMPYISHLGLDTDWPSWDRQKWDAVKPSLKYEDRYLWQWGFWNLLSTILSNEGYQYLIDSLGYYSLVRNWNAAEALSFIAQDFAAQPDFLTLKDGYGHLPAELGEKFVEAGGAVFLHHQLTKFEKDGNGHFLLHFYFRQEQLPFSATAQAMPFHQTVRARKLLLALPHWSLKQLESSNAFNLLEQPELRQRINTVTGVPAFKLFLLYRKRWWEDESGGGIGGGIKHGHSVCDLPLRQTYYFKPDDDAKDSGWGLLMVSYDDGQTVDYWKGMEESQQKKQQGRMELMQRISNLRLAMSFSGFMGAKGENLANVGSSSYVLPPNINVAPTAMIQRAVEQVALLHGKDPQKMDPNDPILNPEIGVYADWSLDPFGGGWNFWRPQINALEVMADLATRSLCSDQDGQEYQVYIVGEAYCGLQGWVEGTLTATEVVLENEFGLKRPGWLPAAYYLGPGLNQPVQVGLRGATQR